MTKKNKKKDAERWNQDRDSMQSDVIITIKSKGYGVAAMPSLSSGRIKYYENRDMWLGRYVFGNEF